MKPSFEQENPFRGTFGNLENFVDHVSETLRCPITIEDTNHRLLAYSMHDDRTDSARISTIIGRRVPEKVINALWKDGVIPTLNKSDDPVRIRSIDDIGLGDRVAITIRKNTEILGYIWALEVEKKLDEEDFLLLKQAASSAKNQLMKLQITREKQQENYQEFFWQLLTGHIDDENDINRHFERLHLSPPPLFSVVVFQFSSSINETTEKQIAYLLKTTQKVDVIFHTSDQKNLVLLVSPKKSEHPTDAIDSFIKTFIHQMKERFFVTMITGGYGTLCEKLTLIEHSYKEATAVLKIKTRLSNETDSIYNYQKLGIYQFIDVIYEKRKADNYNNTSITLLSKYDERHQTNLLETLETYLDKDCNINKASSALHVHVNTLNYRLKRISEISEIDLKDPNEKTTIYIDLKIRKYGALL
ncbi:PucR family transcriptional regulator [Bacillus solimangrovi]|uniref:PucR family transcriptional regulator n=1 Tax=Bacillus solimangrovi TaxID=1305675 RepID=A0A1E5LJR7_9BACI|nr:PucR family transcriptional regulator [Bacillus solimangrovi]OEH94330.1 PucR family transcriptional regulator [Bacillus solimangrovi]